MHQLNPKIAPNPWNEKFLRSGYFFGAVLLHLLVFLMVATLVVFRAPAPPATAEFMPVNSIKVPPPPPQPPATGGAAQNPQFEPQQVTVPVVAPPAVISSFNQSFHVESSKAVSEAISHVTETAQGAGMTSGGGGAGTENGTSLFGSFTGGDTELQGTVYDLKIDPNHKGTGMNQATYTRILHNFVANGWDANVLAPYFKASRKLFTTAIWIPTTPSDACAKEMGLDHELTSRLWVGWYHAKITPIQSGTYHFVGFGDDILAVAINGKLVLDGSLWPVTSQNYPMPWNYVDWSKLCQWRGQRYGMLRVGDNFEVNNIEAVNIDILMGDEPGGFYSAFLMIANNGKNYPAGPNQVPLYPIFQIGSNPIVRPGDQPPHSTSPEAWAAP